jgi:hypothetical protein
MLRSYSKCVRFTPGLSRCLLFLKTTICYTRKNKRHHRGLISLLFSTREFSRVAVVALVGASDFFFNFSIWIVLSHSQSNFYSVYRSDISLHVFIAMFIFWDRETRGGARMYMNVWMQHMLLCCNGFVNMWIVINHQYYGLLRWTFIYILAQLICFFYTPTSSSPSLSPSTTRAHSSSLSPSITRDHSSSLSPSTTKAHSSSLTPSRKW